MAENLIGRTLLGGEYELRDILGRGGMATVYRAWSRSLETDVAVKVLAPRLARDPSFRARFHDEARSLAQLHHPNLVEVHHYGEEDDLVYIVMRLVPAGTLKDRMQVIGGPLDLPSTGRVIGQVAEALQLAHERGLVHLDIKPANVLLGRTDWPLLADFGITRAIETEATAQGRQRLAGTPLYMSPEQCRGGPIDGRSDQYSLAVTTFELLTGQWPFQGETTDALMQHHIADLPPHPRTLNPGIPGPVEDVLLRGLAKTPDERYPSIRQFAAALNAAIEQARGVTLATKQAIARVASGLLAVLALVILGPVLMALLPGGTALGGLIPLAWPFKLLVALLMTAALLPIRWPLIGLATRGLSRLLAAGQADQTSGSTGAQVPRWRTALVGAVEGIVNLAYLFMVYRLVAVPALGIVGALIEAEARLWITTGLAVIILLLSLGIVVRIARTAGLPVAILGFAAAWSAVSVLPTPDLGLLGGLPITWTAKGALTLLIVIGLMATRGVALGFVRQTGAVALTHLIVESKPGASAEEVAATKRRVSELAGEVLDFVYLLGGYALLRPVVVDGIGPALGPLGAAIVFAALAGVIWVVLTLRLRWTAGSVGTALGVLLGAPIVISLPILDPAVIGASWPATSVTWVIGIIAMMMLAAARSQIQAVGHAALSARIDRGLLPTTPAPDEAQAVRRVDAFGGIVAAMLDVFYLVLAFWLLGMPAAQALDRIAGRSGFGSLLLGLLAVCSIVLFVVRVRRALTVVAATGGQRFAAQSRVLSGAAAILVGMLVAGCSATPGVLAMPATAGGLALEPLGIPRLGISWEYVLPWTPDPAHATFDIALSCSDGRAIGQYREAFPSLDAAAMASAGRRTVWTDTPCDAWRDTYFAHRRAAGITQGSSLSRDWLDVQATVNRDFTVDIVESHRVLFTAGSHYHLTWDEGDASETGELRNVEVWEGSTRYVAADTDPTAPYRYRYSDVEGQQRVEWWFPAVESPAERTFTIRYRLEGAVQPASSWRLERTIVAAGGAQPVWRTTAEVILPEGLELEEADTGARGMTYRNGVLGGKTAWFEARDVPAGASFAIIVEFTDGSETPKPTATRTITPTPTTRPTARAVVTARASVTSSPTPTTIATGTATQTVTASASPTPSATSTSTGLAIVPDTTATLTSTPVWMPSTTPTSVATLTPSAVPTSSPTVAPSITPTKAPPSITPTAPPTATPTTPPKPNPTVTPTAPPKATITPTIPTNLPGVPSPTPTRPSRLSPPTATPTQKPIAGAPPYPTAVLGDTAIRCDAPQVLAMYYAWYDDQTWTSGRTADLPTTLYRSADRATIERHVAQAKSVGIDGFELNWWGPGNQTDTNLQTLLSVAGQQGFRVTADFDLNAPVGNTPANVATTLAYLQRYYADPSWFRYGGKPMVVFYGIRKFDVGTWAAIRQQVDPNREVFWMGEGDVFTLLEVFDGIHPYSIAWSPDPPGQLASYASRTRAYPGKVWMATVMPGYDDRKSGYTTTFAVDRRNGEYYAANWQGAIATSPELISISSWNEWVEGHMIEPSRTYGDLYLGLTTKFSATYKQSSTCQPG